MKRVGHIMLVEDGLAYVGVAGGATLAPSV